MVRSALGTYLKENADITIKTINLIYVRRVQITLIFISK